MLGRYRVDRLAAVGGMGAVYRGTDTVLQRAVALKVLPADRAGDAGVAARFAAEALQAAGLSHPNVLPVFDAGETDGVSYVAMQWVDGVTLEQLAADEGPIEVERALAYVSVIAEALDHAHERGLVHRDVKPGNVMVEGAGHLYLMDFGLSVQADRTSGLTRTGEFMATVDYAAPEQIEGGAVDRRADVYALGALAFRLLTGRVPFERDTAMARLYAHLNDPPPVAHEHQPAVPPAASDTICRALDKRPENRPASAGAFAAQLSAAAGGAAPVDPTLIAPMLAAPPRRRVSRRLVAGAAAAVLAALAGMSLAAVTGSDAPPADVPTSATSTPRSSTATTAPAPVADAPADEGGGNEEQAPGKDEAGRRGKGARKAKGKGKAKGR